MAVIMSTIVFAKNVTHSKVYAAEKRNMYLGYEDKTGHNTVRSDG